MKTFNIIFCVVIYKNYRDLIEFVDNLKKYSDKDFTYKIIVVNNFADNDSLNKIKEISLQNNCEFIENENKGYGHANNLGIKYAKENYKFDYLVVCNPDTIIKQFDYSRLMGQEKNIIAPEIICLNGKRQNPMYYVYTPISEHIVYLGFKNRIKLLLYFGILLNKFNRFINRLWNSIIKSEQKIYAGHGSYLIFSHYAIDKLFPVFDEEIFLFCEESDLAKKVRKNNINFIYNKNIVILHKEDGSMNLSTNNLSEIQRESYIYYFEKWKKGYKV